MDVIVIGGGASGLVAAIYAARNNHRVTLLEKNNNCGKKILITGNGKCNYWNQDQDIMHYHTSNEDVLNEIITEENKQEILTFFDELGIVPNIKNGYYYPYSNQATSIQTSLIKEALNNNVNIIYEEVLDIDKENEFVVKTTNKKYKADKVIIATGSKACPKTGSTGIGYILANKFKHNIIKPLPGLVQLKGEGNYFKDWSGIRTEVQISLYENKKFIKQEKGEIQLTDYGVSGICVLNLSSFIARSLDQNKNIDLLINFVPFLDLKTKWEVITFIEQRNKTMINRTVSELLDGFLNYKLVNLLLKLSNIKKDDNWNNLTNNQKDLLSQNLLEFKLKIIGTNSFEQAQVCSGGIPLNEINPNTMESLKQKDLYFVGEVLDVDGDCGGYNLGFAWITGMLAGKGR